jgi:uncharacterized oligopeptide transporter (OPT) family protein
MESTSKKTFKPYISATDSVAEFTVKSILIGSMFGIKTTILENNIIQTTGSAGESIAAGVALTLPGFLFMSMAEEGTRIGETYWRMKTFQLLSQTLIWNIRYLENSAPKAGTCSCLDS